MMLNRGKITLILVGWLLSTISYGGSYTVDYSGGHATISNAPSTPNYTNVGTFGTEPGWGGSWAQSASPCQISCQGAVTATFTFHPAYPGELPPAAVLIKKNVSITWSGSGAFNTGQTPQTSSPNGVLSTKFEVRNNPATTFTATFSPSGSTVNSMGEEFAQPATASVNCTATCYNIDFTYIF